MLRFLFAAAISVLAATHVSAQSVETKAGQAILVDHETGTVLFAKNADEQIPPASLAKLMTMEVVFDALRRGRIGLQDTVRVSEDAWRRGGESSGGSTMFLSVNSEVSIEDLIRGVIVQSGNDASIALAEAIAGSEQTFARLMNDRARAIGMNNSSFRNATGLPDPEQRVTLRDMVTLARHLFETYPEYYRIYAEDSFTWNRIRQPNRNPVLTMGIGGDGLKTGYTEESGYALVASAEQEGDRLFLAMSGLESANDRRTEARSLLLWGFRSFERRRLFERGETVAELRVFGGDAATVPVRAEAPVDLFLPLTGREQLKAEIVYDGPIRTPVEAGERIATLRVTRAGEVTQETPLFAAESVGSGPLYSRAFDAVRESLVFWE